MVIWPLGQIAPLVFLLVVGTLAWPLAAALITLSAISSVVRYLRFQWRLESEALIIEQGLLQRQRRVIPVERVQTVDLVRKVRHRAFGVVEARVEAIGSGSTEGRLDALDPATAERLRAHLLDRSRRRGRTAGADTVPSADEQPVAEEPLARLRPAELVTAGLTGGRVGVAAALLGFAQQVFGQRLEALFARLPAELGTGGIAGLVVISFVGAFILSIIATVVAFWNFTLTRADDTLRVRRGLLEQRHDTLPLRRIQALRVEENLVRRLLGLAAIKVDVAGRAGGDEGRETGTLLPLGRRATAFELAGRVLAVQGVVDDPAVADVLLTPAPRRARNRRLFRAGLGVAVVTAPLVAFFEVVGLTGLALLAPAGAAALASYRALGHAHVPGLVIARSGLLVRRTVFVPTSRLQSLALTATPVQRWRRLATIDLQIARSPGVWPGPQVVDVDAGRGYRLLDTLAGVMVQGRRRASTAAR